MKTQILKTFKKFVSNRLLFSALFILGIGFSANAQAWFSFVVNNNSSSCLTDFEGFGSGLSLGKIPGGVPSGNAGSLNCMPNNLSISTIDVTPFGCSPITFTVASLPQTITFCNSCKAPGTGGIITCTSTTNTSCFGYSTIVFTFTFN